MTNPKFNISIEIIYIDVVKRNFSLLVLYLLTYYIRIKPVNNNINYKIFH